MFSRVRAVDVNVVNMPSGSILKKQEVQLVKVAFVHNPGTQDPKAGGARPAWATYCQNQKLAVLSAQLSSPRIKGELLWRGTLSRSNSFRR